MTFQLNVETVKFGSEPRKQIYSMRKLKSLPHKNLNRTQNALEQINWLKQINKQTNDHFVT